MASPTFEALRQGDETPEQVIRRLQASQAREARQRVRRQDRGEAPATTALVLLDQLRQPIPTTSNEPLPSVKPFEISNQPRSSIASSPSRENTVSGPLELACHSYPRDSEKEAETHIMGLSSPHPTNRSVQPTTEAIEPNGSSQVIDKSTRSVTRLYDTTMPSYESATRFPQHDPRTDRVDNSRSIEKISNAKPGRSRWATAAEMRAPPIKVDSNAEGSEESESELDSTQQMGLHRGLGRLIRSRKPLIPEERLVGWDGQMQPPPADWEFRTRFYNNTPEHIRGFESWLATITTKTMVEISAPEVSFAVIPADEVANVHNHPDGIGFISRDTLLGPRNHERYGHKLSDSASIDSRNPVNFDGDAKLDLSDPSNARYKDETAGILVARHLARIQRAKQEAEQNAHLQREAERLEKLEAETAEKEAIAAAEEEEKQAAAVSTAKNVYLRPAVEADAPGIAAVLNWHIANSIHPTELAPIVEDDIIDRITMSQHARLPFIVAIERTRKSSRTKSRRGPRVSPDHPIQNIDPDYLGVTRDEPVIGWASATDWAAANYVEATTAELEMYVAAHHRKSGVGRCLMDAILEATDRGYNRRNKYDFRVAPELKHMYNGGGGRDLHKLIFQVRSYNKICTPEQEDRLLRASSIAEGPVRPSKDSNYHRAPKNYGDLNTSTHPESPKRDYSKAARIDDREDDYEVWLKEWLESYDFEEEALLKKMGTKNHRFVDLRYLVKETCWQPREGRVPDYTNGY